MADNVYTRWQQFLKTIYYCEPAKN